MTSNKVQKAIKQLNEKWAVVNLDGKTAVLHETTNPNSGDTTVQFFPVESFHHYLANQQIEISEQQNSKKSKKSIPVSKLWFKSPTRRQYRGVIFDPQRVGNDNGYYNFFRGFAVKPKPGKWLLMKNHIQEVICNNDQLIFKYVLAWLADLFQNPGRRRPGVALVLKGDQGTGKGIFASNIGQIVRPHFLHVTSPRHFTGRFNQHLKDRLLIFVDEGVWGGDKQTEGIIKGYITEDTLLIEPKGVNTFEVANHMRVIIASNNDWVVPVGQGERRMFVLEIPNRYQGDYEYFGDIAKQMDAGGREAMLYDLLKYKSDLDLRDFPRTAAFFDQAIRNWSPTHHFWFERLKEGVLDPNDDFWTGSVPLDQLYMAYIDYCETSKDRYIEKKEVFAKTMRKMCPFLKRTYPRVEGRRQANYEFPNLDTCRELFEKKIKVSLATVWE